MTKSATAIRVKTNVRAGGLTYQHNRSAIKVRTGVQAGGLTYQHNRSVLTA